MLKTVIRNLLSNAIKYSHKGGTIVLEAYITYKLIEVQVKDNGVGITSNRKDNLFEIGKIISTKGTDNERGTG